MQGNLGDVVRVAQDRLLKMGRAEHPEMAQLVLQLETVELLGVVSEQLANLNLNLEALLVGSAPESETELAGPPDEDAQEGPQEAEEGTLSEEPDAGDGLTEKQRRMAHARAAKKKKG